MGKLFKKANAEATVTHTFGEEDGADYIRVRSELSKAEANDIIKHIPTEQRDLEGYTTLLERLFEKVVVAWSMEDEKGKPVAPLVENYREMTAEGAALIDEKLRDVLNGLFGARTEQLEGESVS
jgi:predicted transcriptional regulator